MQATGLPYAGMVDEVILIVLCIALSLRVSVKVFGLILLAEIARLKIRAGGYGLVFPYFFAYFFN